MKEMPRSNDSSLSPRLVIGWAFTIWLAMLVVVLMMFVFTIFLAEPTLTPEAAEPGMVSFLIVIAICAGIVATVSFVHRHLFRVHWRDGVVEPGAFLRASVILWTGLALSAIVPQIACVIQGTLFPYIIVSGAMMMTLLATWPKGRAMTHPRLHEEEDSDEEVMHLPDEDEPPYHPQSPSPSSGQ